MTRITFVANNPRFHIQLLTALMISVVAGFGTICMADESIDLTTRGDVTQRFLWMPREGATASVILFAGGTGRIKITEYGDINKEGNFLVRSRDEFAGHKLNVAVIDAPSDHYSKKGMKVDYFRDSSEHAEDIAAVITYIKKQAAIPVWLVGTSRGTESAANGAISLGGKVDGLILTASMTEENNKGISLPEMELHKIKAPTLIVSHEDDACHVTPPEGAEDIKEGLLNASKVEIKFFSGGDEPTSKPCKAKSAHGFLGIEDKVVKFIADFIKAN